MADPVERKYEFYQGEKFEVTWTFGPAVTGETVDITDAIVRIAIDGNTRDSTVANSEIAVTSDSVSLTMLESDTAALSVGMFRGEVIVIDGAGEDQIPVTLLMDVRQRLAAPV